MCLGGRNQRKVKQPRWLLEETTFYKHKYYMNIYEYLIEGSLNSKLPTIWRVEKQMTSR